MASTAPAKSQPLHNFSLPHLIWKNHRSGRNRLAGDTSSSSPPHRSPATPLRDSPPPPRTSHADIVHHHHHHHPLRQTSPPYVPRRPSPLHRQSPMREFESESERSYAVPIENPSRRVTPENPAKSFDAPKGKRSNKISIRFRKNSDVKHDGGAAAVTDDNAVPPSAAEEDESSPKTWNLRPRRPPMKHKHLTGGLPKIGSSSLPENGNSHGSNNTNRDSSKVRTNDPITTTTKKQKFSISLSRDEIEEDLFSMTGLKPSRRPKKRPRSVQKQLDVLFPGLWLGTITADSYKVDEPLLKG